MVDLVDIKTRSRRLTHSRMAVPVVYTAEDADDSVLGITARWHNRKGFAGLGNDTADIFEGVERLVFNAEQLEELGVVLERNAVVEFPGYGSSFRLDIEEETDGPVLSYWTVSRIVEAE